MRKSLKTLSQAGNYPKFVLLRRMARMNFVNGHDYSEHLKLQVRLRKRTELVDVIEYAMNGNKFFPDSEKFRCGND